MPDLTYHHPRVNFTQAQSNAPPADTNNHVEVKVGHGIESSTGAPARSSLLRLPLVNADRDVCCAGVTAVGCWLVVGFLVFLSFRVCPAVPLLTRLVIHGNP